MAKEEYETPLIDVYNRTHMDALHEDGGWYHRFLPDGVFLEDLGQIIEEELINAYNEAERESDEFFEARVKELFADIFDNQHLDILTRTFCGYPVSESASDVVKPGLRNYFLYLTIPDPNQCFPWFYYQTYICGPEGT